MTRATRVVVPSEHLLSENRDNFTSQVWPTLRAELSGFRTVAGRITQFSQYSIIALEHHGVRGAHGSSYVRPPGF